MLFHKQAINAVLPATTQDDTRYFLDAVQVEPDGTLVATNGHVLIKAKDIHPFPDEDFPQVPGGPFHGNIEKPITIASGILKRLISVMPKRATLPVLHRVQIGRNGSADSAIASATDLQTPLSVTITPDPDRQFPSYERLWPNPQATVTITLGVPVLEVLIKSATAIGTDRLTFTLPTDKPTINGQITVEYAKDGIEAKAIAMPIAR